MMDRQDVVLTLGKSPGMVWGGGLKTMQKLFSLCPVRGQQSTTKKGIAGLQAQQQTDLWRSSDYLSVLLQQAHGSA